MYIVKHSNKYQLCITLNHDYYSQLGLTEKDTKPHPTYPGPKFNCNIQPKVNNSTCNIYTFSDFCVRH